MRKSERLRIAELEIMRLNFEIEYLKAVMNAFVESGGFRVPDMDAGKWYSKKPGDPNIPNN